MAVMRHVNETVFQKTLAFSDFYFGADDWDYPLGLVQMCATSHPEQVRGEALPGWLEWLPRHAVRPDRAPLARFLAAGRGPADPDNRVYYKDGKVHLDLAETNPEALKHLKRKLKEVLDRSAWPAVLLERSLYLGKDIPLCAAPRIRRAPAASAPIRRPRCSTSTAVRTRSTISTSPTRASSRRSAR